MGKQAKLKQLRGLKREAILRLYQKVAGEVLSKRFTPDCCLNGTRVAIEVMAHFDIEVRPLTTAVMVFSKGMWSKIQDKGDFPK